MSNKVRLCFSVVKWFSVFLWFGKFFLLYLTIIFIFFPQFENVYFNKIDCNMNHYYIYSKYESIIVICIVALSFIKKNNNLFKIYRNIEYI